MKEMKTDLKEIALDIRKKTMEIIHNTGSPHIGSSFSIVEILTALYFSQMNVSPDTPNNPDRDRFILSKGHACATLYATLYAKGFMTAQDLEGFAIDGGLLEHHPIKDIERGIEVSTGSLGHGLSVGSGMALAGKLDAKDYGVYVLLSDGELNEGSVWEAVMFSAHHKLSKLTAFIDSNRIQALGCTRDIIDLEPLTDKWRSFGWDVLEADGHDIDSIIEALNRRADDKPSVVVLHTIKGKGVSFMEDKLLWHYRCPDKDEYARALKELEV